MAIMGFDNYAGQRVEYGFLMPDDIITLSESDEKALCEGAEVFAEKSGEMITVGRELSSSGGQGIIYESADSRYVIKLYRKEARRRRNAEKLKKMLELKNADPSVCWPCDILRTRSGAFVGFIMPRVEGKNLYSLTTNPLRVMKSYPKFNRLCQVKMILDILRIFKTLHGANVIVGDVKLENIMFDASFRPTVIDLDSAQIDQFPCESSTAGYDAPEVMLSRGREHLADKLPDGTYEFNRYYSDFYRTLKIESFSLSVLIYRFLMNGNLPYDYQDLGKYGDDGDYNDNELCVSGSFPYSTSQEKTEESCREKVIWSHFPSFLKIAFENTFRYGRRYSDAEWIEIFKRYKRMLESGELAATDPECMKAFPEQQIDYASVNFSLSKTVEKSGFAMWHTVGRIANSIGDPRLKRRVFEVARELKEKPECAIDGYRFSLLYNIGVLKKVRCEYIA